MNTSTLSTTHATQSTPGRGRLQIAIMAVAAFAIVTTEYLILGLLPALARDLRISISMAGQLVTLFAFTVMLFGPLLTARLSHVGRKGLFVAILLVFCAANALAALAPNIWVLALARFIPALMLPVFWGTASETAGQLAGPGNAGRAVATVYLGISAALVFGIPLGTLASDAFGWRNTFWILSALSLLMAVLMQLCMPALPRPAATHGEQQSAMLRDPRFLAHVGLSVLVFTAMFTAYTYLADFLGRVAGIPSAHVGWWLMGFGLVGMLGNWIGGRVVDANPLGATIGFLALLVAGMVAALLLPARHGWLALAVAAWGLAYTALFPICQVRVMKAGSKAQALAASMNISAANAGTGLGAIFGGLGIEHVGLGSLGYLASGIAVLGIVVAWLMRRPATLASPAH
ncbi:MFS transporter [Massilia dura]|uniref:MFS transporter n=1 Tax=Pseudoduganella dura TaxID=321982 RepID=A0A6I3XBF3_9BURK|nr:MFS transporter [Pseudoduganella dura]MUI14274.1 MFS transporter [Pseudoduganella dura]GGX76132.1 MFS transporter [Pseudoduganella dura]